MFMIPYPSFCEVNLWRLQPLELQIPLLGCFGNHTLVPKFSSKVVCPFPHQNLLGYS